MASQNDPTDFPEQEVIDAWKEQHGKVYSMSAAGVDFIFREITLGEFQGADRGQTSADREDAIIKHGLLHPKDVDLDKLPAGAASRLARDIVDRSNFGEPKVARRLLDAERERSDSVFGLIKAFIIATMPAYTEEDLEQLTFRQLAAKVALAEQIIKVNQAAFEEGDLTLDIIDEEEEQARAEQDVRKHAARKKAGEAGLNDPIAQRLRQSMGG